MVIAVITLPLLYNPDQRGKRKAVEEAKFRRTMREVAERFGGCFLEGQIALGSFFTKGRFYLDPEIRLKVHIPDNAESRDWLRQYEKEVLRNRFQQEAIYITIEGWAEPL